MGDHVSASSYPSSHLSPPSLHPQSSELPLSENNQPETTASSLMDTSNTDSTDVTSDSTKSNKAHLQLNIPVTFTSSDDDDLTPTEACFDPHQHHSHHHWFHAILDSNDFKSIHEHRFIVFYRCFDDYFSGD